MMKISIIYLICCFGWEVVCLGKRISSPRKRSQSPETPQTVAQNNREKPELTIAEIFNACIQERAESPNYTAMSRQIIGYLKPC